MFNQIKIVLVLLFSVCFTFTMSAATVDTSTHLRISQIEPVQVQNESANLAESPDSGFQLQRILF